MDVVAENFLECLFIKPEAHKRMKDSWVEAGLFDPSVVDRFIRNGEYDENLSTTYHQKEPQFDFKSFYEESLRPCLEAYFSEIPWQDLHALDDPHGSWHQSYEDGGYHSVHDHHGGDTGICLIYFLHLEGENTTVFYPRDGTPHIHSGDFVKEGCILVFSPKLLHSVDPTDGKKITICYNLVYKPAK